MPDPEERKKTFTIEDLINEAFHINATNKVHFKILQTVLHLLARQLRMLNQNVEIIIQEREEEITEGSLKSAHTTEGKDDGERETKKEPKGRSEGAETGGGVEGETEKSMEKKGGKDEAEIKKDMKGKTGVKKSEDDDKDQGTEKKMKPKGSGADQHSIEVVTREEFETLKKMVETLKNLSGPLPTPVMPDNQTLRDDIEKGKASLTDAMDVMQLTSRVDATEKAINNMRELLKQLASSGDLPEKYAAKAEALSGDFETIKSKLQKDKSDVTIPLTKGMSTADAVGESKTVGKARSVTGKSSVGFEDTDYESSEEAESEELENEDELKPASAKTVAAAQPAPIIGVTHPELDSALAAISKNIMNKTKEVPLRTDVIATKSLNLLAPLVPQVMDRSAVRERVQQLSSLAAECDRRLQEFDDLVQTEMEVNNKAAQQMRADLDAAHVLVASDINPDAIAINYLKEDYQVQVDKYEDLLLKHAQCVNIQKILQKKMRNVENVIEELKQWKMDKSELDYGLSLKMDMSFLEGMPSEDDLTEMRMNVLSHLDMYYDMFTKQECTWLNVIQEVKDLISAKAELSLLVALREDAQDQLNEVKGDLNKLALIVGDPELAKRIRQLSKCGTCGVCELPAIMDIQFRPRGQRTKLKGPLTVREAPSERALRTAMESLPPPEPKHRVHLCRRYVGGSHTKGLRVPPALGHGPAAAAFVGPPMRRIKGQTFMLEEPVSPCEECNEPETEVLLHAPPVNKESSRRFTVEGTGDVVPGDLDAEGLSVVELPGHRVTYLNLERPGDDGDYAPVPDQQRMGDKPLSDQIGDKPTSDQIGDKPISDQIGDMLPPEQIGDKSQLDQIGDKSQLDQIGDKSQLDQIGDKSQLTTKRAAN